MTNSFSLCLEEVFRAHVEHPFSKWIPRVLQQTLWWYLIQERLECHTTTFWGIWEVTHHINNSFNEIIFPSFGLLGNTDSVGMTAQLKPSARWFRLQWRHYERNDQRKHQSSASLAFARGIHRWPENSLHKGPVTRNMCHLMASSCNDHLLVYYISRPIHKSTRWGLGYKAIIWNRTFQTHVDVMHLEHFQQICPHINSIGSILVQVMSWWVPSGNKSLPEPMLLWNEWIQKSFVMQLPQTNPRYCLNRGKSVNGYCCSGLLLFIHAMMSLYISVQICVSVLCKWWKYYILSCLYTFCYVMLAQI